MAQPPALRHSLSVLLLMGCVVSGTSRAAATPPTLDELLTAVDNTSRGASSTATLTMHVKNAHYERTMTMDIATQGTERTLIRITAPAKEAGVSTLKVGDKIWNYLPKVDRTMKIPSGMMGGSWMGSHFTNDDLVKESRYSEDFTGQITESPATGADHYTVTLTPKPDAPVVWGSITLTISPEQTPQAVAYYDEDGALIRTMSFHDVQPVDGVLTPMRIRLTPADEPGEFTELTYSDLHYNVALPKSTFTLQALKR